MESYLVITIVLIVIIKIIQKKPVFIMNIKGKKITTKGNAPSKFINEATLIAKDYKIIGTIKGMKKENGIKLEFSKSIKPPNQQKFKNVFPYASYTKKKKDNYNKAG